MKTDIIKIPVTAHMQRQPDGSWQMIEAEYMETTADVIAHFLLDRFHVPYRKEVEPNCPKAR